MENEEFTLKAGTTIKLVNKSFTLDWDKVDSHDKIIAVLKVINPVFNWYSEECPVQFKELNELGLLIEQK